MSIAKFRNLGEIRRKKEKETGIEVSGGFLAGES